MGDFTFQQFSIRQDRTAMKVGTDGVLLGAWAEGGRRVLDIGTGTGLIALMMAQRFPEASVLGLDIDAAACQQARENVLRSPFAGRIEVVHASLQTFAGGVEEPHSALSSLAGNGGKFDSIVSNPPFFENSLKAPDAQRSTARHADTLPFADLFAGVAGMLSPDGVFSAIVPADHLDRFCSHAHLSGLFLSRQCNVKTTPRKPFKRVLLAFRRQRPKTFDRYDVCLQEADGSRSEWYRGLTADFYLR